MAVEFRNRCCYQHGPKIYICRGQNLDYIIIPRQGENWWSFPIHGGLHIHWKGSLAMAGWLWLLYPRNRVFASVFRPWHTSTHVIRGEDLTRLYKEPTSDYELRAYTKMINERWSDWMMIYIVSNKNRPVVWSLILQTASAIPSAFPRCAQFSRLLMAKVAGFSLFIL